MARFAQYYLEYNFEFAPHGWEDRQKHLGELFAKDDSIVFYNDEGKECKHRVYHLECNPEIILMRFANHKELPIEKDFKPDVAPHEPSCYVMLDNRDKMRSIAIHKRKEAFNSPGQVAKIVERCLTEELYKNHCYSVSIKPDYYPEDLYKTWERVQQHVSAIRFGVPDIDPELIIQKIEELRVKGKAYFDDTLMKPIMQLALEAKKAKYKHLYTLMPEDKNVCMFVDRDSTFVRNLITMSAALDQPIELVTNDSGTFRCFVEADEDNTDKVVNKEFDPDLLEMLFTGKDSDDNDLSEKRRAEIETKIVEFLYDIQHEAKDEGQAAAIAS